MLMASSLSGICAGVPLSCARSRADLGQHLQFQLAEPLGIAHHRDADDLAMRTECTCGCGSIALLIDRDSQIQADVTERIPVEGRSSVASEDGAPVEVLLHVA